MTKSDQDGALERKLAGLLARVNASASADPDPTLHHQLGDVYGELGRRPDALKHYGKAIDGFLATGRASVAMAICNKLVKRYPDVTRTYFTLACGALHSGNVEEGIRLLGAYADAARLGDTNALAIPRLRFLAGLVTDPNVRTAIGKLLERLGDEDVQKVTQGEPSAYAASLTKEKRREMLLEVAGWGSDAIWSGYWLRT